MTTLRDQLRQAVSVEQRCEAIKALVWQIRGADKDPSLLRALLATIEEAERFAPTLLVGVVLAIVPDLPGFTLLAGEDGACAIVGRPFSVCDLNHYAPECALAIALLDAGAAKEVERG